MGAVGAAGPTVRLMEVEVLVDKVDAEIEAAAVTAELKSYDSPDVWLL